MDRTILVFGALVLLFGSASAQQRCGDCPAINCYSAALCMNHIPGEVCLGHSICSLVPGTAKPCQPPWIVCCGCVYARLAEIRIDMPGADTDEYFELEGVPGTSLNGLTYIVLGDGTGGSGVIETAVDLSALSIQPDSVLVVGDSGTSGSHVYTYDAELDLNFENSDNVTHMLVQDFSGSLGEDLDTNDDGVLDTTPWTSIVDCVALVETPGSGDLLYCGERNVGPDGSFVPGHISICEGAWSIGEFALGVDDTPGQRNPCAPVSVDASTWGRVKAKYR